MLIICYFNDQNKNQYPKNVRRVGESSNRQAIKITNSVDLLINQWFIYKSNCSVLVQWCVYISIGDIRGNSHIIMHFTRDRYKSIESTVFHSLSGIDIVNTEPPMLN